MFIEQGHLCRRFVNKPFFKAFPHASHAQGIIKPCLSSKTRLGGVIIGIEPSVHGAADVAGSIVADHLYRAVAARVREKTAEDKSHPYRRYADEA